MIKRLDTNGESRIIYPSISDFVVDIMYDSVRNPNGSSVLTICEDLGQDSVDSVYRYNVELCIKGVNKVFIVGRISLDSKDEIYSWTKNYLKYLADEVNKTAKKGNSGFELKTEIVNSMLRVSNNGRI